MFFKPTCLKGNTNTKNKEVKMELSRSEIKVNNPFNSCSLNIFREGTEFFSLFKLLQSFAPRKENALWPLIVVK